MWNISREARSILVFASVDKLSTLQLSKPESIQLHGKSFITLIIWFYAIKIIEKQVHTLFQMFYLFNFFSAYFGEIKCENQHKIADFWVPDWGFMQVANKNSISGISHALPPSCCLVVRSKTRGVKRAKYHWKWQFYGCQIGDLCRGRFWHE